MEKKEHPGKTTAMANTVARTTRFFISGKPQLLSVLGEENGLRHPHRQITPK
ncbi:hypothetical protein [Thiolapillus sp.]|uniref:hypothetical protein n=1 Tax=Thiolapillus sp. TaxID=2017437 RepID=UPI003AF74524